MVSRGIPQGKRGCPALIPATRNTHLPILKCKVITDRTYRRHGGWRVVNSNEDGTAIKPPGRLGPGQ